MIETIELTPAVTGLGNLHEPALLALVADTHYRIITQGGSATPREITNKAGEPLYPSIFALHVRVPPQRLLGSYELWRRFDVGVDVRSFGRQFLDVNGVIGDVGEVPDVLDAWDNLVLPRVSWAGAWTLTRADGEHEPSLPTTDFLGSVPRIAKVPTALSLAREVQLRRAITPRFTPDMKRTPVRYQVAVGRDASIGRQMMFSQFVVVCDTAERTFLTQHVAPAFPAEIVDALATIERRIVYVGNARADETIDVHVTARCERSSPTSFVIATAMELVHAGRLLALAETRKLVALSETVSGVSRVVDQLFSAHGEGPLHSS